MPIYEYECPVCGRFEMLQRMSEGPLQTCPRCAEKGLSSDVRKLMSASSFHLKGSGWYKTDYSSSSSSSSSGESNGSSLKSTVSKTTDTPASSSTETTSTPAAPSTESSKTGESTAAAS